MKLFGLIGKGWEVVDDRGITEDEYWRRKNAQAFADDMNKWSAVYFGGRKFFVRRKRG